MSYAYAGANIAKIEITKNFIVQLEQGVKASKSYIDGCAHPVPEGSFTISNHILVREGEICYHLADDVSSVIEPLANSTGW